MFTVNDQRTRTFTIPVGDAPIGVAVSPDGRRAYVTNRDSDTVSVIDTATTPSPRTIPVGDSPVGVAVTPDGRRAYITNADSGTVSVIDTASDTVTGAPSRSATPPAGWR